MSNRIASHADADQSMLSAATDDAKSARDRFNKTSRHGSWSNTSNDLFVGFDEPGSSERRTGRRRGASGKTWR
jgi:hypothetical protein